MSSSPAAPTANEALPPVSADRRVFQWHDHASLWFSLGVGLLVMQVGAYLMPALGTKEALIAIVAGSIVGAGLLGWVAKLGCDSGLASAGLMHAVYGRTFASLQGDLGSRLRACFSAFAFWLDLRAPFCDRALGFRLARLGLGNSFLLRSDGLSCSTSRGLRSLRRFLGLTR